MKLSESMLTSFKQEIQRAAQRIHNDRTQPFNGAVAYEYGLIDCYANVLLQFGYDFNINYDNGIVVNIEYFGGEQDETTND